MKKLFTIITCLLVITCLTACGKKEEENTPKDDYDLTGTFGYRYVTGDPVIIDASVRIDYANKEIKVDEKRPCYEKGCTPFEKKYKGKVNSERMKKIHQIIELLDFKNAEANEEEKGMLITIFIYLTEEDKTITTRE